VLEIENQSGNSTRISPEEIRAFLKASDELRFQGQNREEVYGWVNQTLRQHHGDPLPE
jgi:hypothetical protein